MYRKQKLSLILVSIFVLSLFSASCGHMVKKQDNNPEMEAALAGYFKKLQKVDFTKAADYVDDSVLETVTRGEVYDDVLKAYASTFSYSITSSKSYDSKGTGVAEITLTFADLEDIQDSFEDDYSINEFVSEISAKKAPTSQKKLKIDFIKNGKWIIASDEKIVEVLFKNWEDICAPFFKPETTETEPDITSEPTATTTVDSWEQASKDISKEGWYCYDTESYQIRSSSSQYYAGYTDTIEYSIRFYQYYPLDGYFTIYDEDEQELYKANVTSYMEGSYCFLDCTYSLGGEDTFEAGTYRLEIFVNDRLIRNETIDVLENNPDAFEETVVSEGFYDYTLRDYVDSYSSDITDCIEYSFHFSEDIHLIVYFCIYDAEGTMLMEKYAATYASDNGAYLDCSYYNDDGFFEKGTYKIEIYTDDELLREKEVEIK